MAEELRFFYLLSFSSSPKIHKTLFYDETTAIKGNDTGGQLNQKNQAIESLLSYDVGLHFLYLLLYQLLFLINTQSTK